MIDLSGAKSKIARANHHINDLERARAAFLAHNPYTLTPEYYVEQNATGYFLDECPSIPNEISLLIGDAAHNLRTALDLLAYSLANDHSPRINLSHIYFPICENAGGYEAESTRKTKGMSKASIDAIRAIQPYGGGNDLLWGLHRLDIIDKHRLLVTAVVVVDKIGFDVETERVQNAFRGVFGLAPNAIPKQTIYFGAPASIEPPKKGALMFWIAGNHENDRDVQFTFDITFAEPTVFKGKPIVATLRNISHTVNEIVAGFG